MSANWSSQRYCESRAHTKTQWEYKKEQDELLLIRMADLGHCCSKRFTRYFMWNKGNFYKAKKNQPNKILYFNLSAIICLSAYVGILEKLDSKPMLKTLKQPEFRWPVVGDGLGGEYQWSEGQWNLLKTLAEMRNQHSKSVLIRLYVSPDDKNSSQYIIKVRHPLVYNQQST